MGVLTEESLSNIVMFFVMRQWMWQEKASGTLFKFAQKTYGTCLNLLPWFG